MQQPDASGAAILGDLGRGPLAEAAEPRVVGVLGRERADAGLRLHLDLEKKRLALQSLQVSMRLKSYLIEKKIEKKEHGERLKNENLNKGP